MGDGVAVGAVVAPGTGVNVGGNIGAGVVAMTGTTGVKDGPTAGLVAGSAGVGLRCGVGAPGTSVGDGMGEGGGLPGVVGGVGLVTTAAAVAVIPGVARIVLAATGVSVTFAFCSCATCAASAFRMMARVWAMPGASARAITTAQAITQASATPATTSKAYGEAANFLSDSVEEVCFCKALIYAGVGAKARVAFLPRSISQG